MVPKAGPPKSVRTIRYCQSGKQGASVGNSATAGCNKAPPCSSMNSTPQALELPEGIIMKLIFKMSVLLAAAFFSTTGSAASTTDSSTLLLAEGGSDRLLDYHQENTAARNQFDQSAGERYVQMVKEQPTASGVTVTEEALPTTNEPVPRLTSPIIRDREQYRSAH